MTQYSEVKTLKIVVLIFGLISLVYGLFFLVVPGWYYNITGAESVSFVYIRVLGGVLFALGLGALMFYRNPVNGNVFIITISISAFLGGVALFYSLLIGDYGGSAVYIALPAVLGIALSPLLLWSLKKAKEG